MNYEPAKKLKDAGFPQKGKGELHETEEGRKSRDSMGSIDSIGTYLTQVVYSPTLSELIEACGDDLIDLRRDGEGWAAISNLTFEGRFDSVISLYGSGQTPEEAVANLWLALNAK